MCGIVGYIGSKKTLPVLLKGLKKLEYRGYDSAGLAVACNGGIVCEKAVGKVVELEKKISKLNIEEGPGIAHTRWATHGKPTLKNAHPHSGQNGRIWLAHNGIIENYRELKKELEKKGHKFKSETDSEVLAHLVEEFAEKLSVRKALEKALNKVEGTYGLAVLDKKTPGKLWAARKGSPLLIGVGDEDYIIASDASAIINYTKQVVYLEDGDIAEISPDNFEVFNQSESVDKKSTELTWSAQEVKKQGYPHFMLKEIFEQPKAVEDAIRGRVDKFISEDSNPMLGGLAPVQDRLRKIEKLVIVSCGTSYYAGLTGEYFLEEYAGIPTEVEYASEFRYRKPLLDEKTAVLAISQSGETADTLEALREAKLKGALTLGIVNVVGSTISRETDAGVYNHAGPEIGVASTKAFTSQLAVLALLALSLGRQRSMSYVMSRRIAQELKRIPGLVQDVLDQSGEIKKKSKKYLPYKNWLYLGRKYNFPIAMEGALKIKEISYIHAEGYPAGEMKHGPIAMIDPDFPSFFLSPQDSVYSKVASGMEEVKSRGGKVLAVATRGDKKIANLVDEVIYIPKTLEMLTPFLSVVVLQLFAYHFGVGLGYDVDKPRNLAKSVTVE
ncbi:MAG: glutamine--fructose-6-phosphate transaminase (isomerizing) [Candidatus Moranbacteria bacterium]|nr:glutamine--fructose-6-phosphate transaminase (isomerizing) [Candidatus Moranbacteria bacterium]